MSKSLLQLGYMSVEQLQEYAVENDEYSQVLATYVFRGLVRQYFLPKESEDTSDAASLPESRAPAFIEIPESSGQTRVPKGLINVGVLKHALDSGELSRREAEHASSRMMPKIFSEQKIALLAGFIEERSRFLGEVAAVAEVVVEQVATD